MKTRVLFGGSAAGDLLVTTAPLSFWGGVDAATGRIVASRHPQIGEYVGGRLLAIPSPIGSSSSSSILLELIRCGHAPAGLILGGVDAILVVGCIVGRELRYQAPPVVELSSADIASLQPGRYQLSPTGDLTLLQ
jgi:uncharacterized protein